MRLRKCLDTTAYWMLKMVNTRKANKKSISKESNNTDNRLDWIPNEEDIKAKAMNIYANK